MNDWMPCSTLDRRTRGREETRPKPVRRRGRRAVRVFARLVVLAVALLLASLVARKVARPFVLCYGEARSAGEISTELRDIRRENVQLEQQKRYLSSKRGAQTEARKLGWLMPGERVLVIENPPEKDER